MTWRQVAPGIYEGLPGKDYAEQETELRVRMSNIPPETMKTHRLETWEHKPDEPWWPSSELRVPARRTLPSQ